MTEGIQCLKMTEFDQHAERYEELLNDPIRERFAPGSQFFRLRKWELLQEILKHRGIDKRRASWLDVGCGKGELLELGEPEMAAVAGCDVSQEMLDRSSVRTVARQDDPSRLPFSDAKFDLVTAVCVFHHVPPAERAGLIAEMRRVLRPGGIACMVEHNPWNPATRLIVSRTPVDANAELLTARAAARLFSEGGFRDSRSEYFLYLPEALYLRLGWLERLFSSVPLGGQYAVHAQKAE